MKILFCFFSKMPITDLKQVRKECHWKLCVLHHGVLLPVLFKAFLAPFLSWKCQWSEERWNKLLVTEYNCKNDYHIWLYIVLIHNSLNVFHNRKDFLFPFTLWILISLTNIVIWSLTKMLMIRGFWYMKLWCWVNGSWHCEGAWYLRLEGEEVPQELLTL
jgi:hypothetical protein